jgi:hypothetical protein
LPTSYWDEDIKLEQEKVNVKGIEMLYMEVEGGPSKNITWIYEIPGSNQKYEYNIETSAKDITKEKLIKIAEAHLK